MKLKATGTTSDNNLIDDGHYDAILKRIDECGNADGTYLKWDFAVSVHGEARTITGVSPTHLEAGSKSRFWTEALLGRPLKDDEEVDLEKLYGRPCRLEVTTINKEGRDFNRIAKVTKRGGLTLPAKKAAVAEPTSDEVENPF